MEAAEASAGGQAADDGERGAGGRAAHGVERGAGGITRRAAAGLALGAAVATQAYRGAARANDAGVDAAVDQGKAQGVPAGERPLPIEVAAYYFPNFHRDPRSDAWYGEGWTEWELVKAARPRFEGHRQPIVPAWGYFDESDPAWTSHEITLAADHGITAFLYDWYWYDGEPFLQAALEEGFLQAPERRRLKFALMWANHDWQHIQPASLHSPPPVLARGAVSPAEFDRLTDCVVERYFSQPNYLTLDGLPYFTIYELSTFVAGMGGIEAARAALERFAAKARTAGYDGVHVNGIVWGAAGSVSPSTALPVPRAVETAVALGASSLGSYTWFHHHDGQVASFPRGSYARTLDQYVAWSERSRRFPLDYHPNVTMGWDPSPRTVQSEPYVARGYPWTAILEGNSPDLFRAGLERARAYLDRTPGGPQQLVTLNAWNEWTEGSYLLPDTEHGTAYLEAVRAVFGQGGGGSPEPR